MTRPPGPPPPPSQPPGPIHGPLQPEYQWQEPPTLMPTPKRTHRRRTLVIAAIVIGILVGVFVVVFTTKPAHADNGLMAFPKDLVYVVDQAPSRWPVYTAAEELDNYSDLEIVVVTKCPTTYTDDSHQCLFVREKDFPHDRVGYTNYYTPNGIDIYYSMSFVSKYWGGVYDYKGRKHIVCHEIAHALGIKQHLTGASCLASWQYSSPGHPVFEELRARYGSTGS